MLTLKALPGRLILRFPRPKEKEGEIYIPDRIQQRPDIGLIHDVGEPMNPEQEKLVPVLRELQKQHIPLCVSYGNGTCYWTVIRDNTLNEEEWGWMRDYRSYRIEEPAVFLVEEDAGDEVTEIVGAGV